MTRLEEITGARQYSRAATWGLLIMISWFKRKLAMWELNALLKELEENLEYQAWLQQELECAKFRRIELLHLTRK